MKYKSELHLRIDSSQKLLLTKIAEDYCSNPSQIVRHLIKQNLHNLERNKMFA